MGRSRLYVTDHSAKKRAKSQQNKARQPSRVVIGPSQLPGGNRSKATHGLMNDEQVAQLLLDWLKTAIA